MDLKDINQVRVPRSLVDHAQVFLRKVGRTGREGMVLWVGNPDGQTFNVTDMLIPRQKGIKTEDGVCVVVDADEMHRINVELYKSGKRIVAQEHSHPKEAFHSTTDDNFAIATTVGSLSLVIPDFATRAFSLLDCAIYRLDERGSWLSVSAKQAQDLLVFEDS